MSTRPCIPPPRRMLSRAIHVPPLGDLGGFADLVEETDEGAYVFSPRMEETWEEGLHRILLRRKHSDPLSPMDGSHFSSIPASSHERLRRNGEESTAKTTLALLGAAIGLILVMSLFVLAE